LANIRDPKHIFRFFKPLKIHNQAQSWLFQSENIQIHGPTSDGPTTLWKRRISRFARNAAREFRLTWCARLAVTTWAALWTAEPTMKSRRLAKRPQSKSRNQKRRAFELAFGYFGLPATGDVASRSFWRSSGDELRIW